MPFILYKGNFQSNPKISRIYPGETQIKFSFNSPWRWELLHLGHPPLHAQAELLLLQTGCIIPASQSQRYAHTHLLLLHLRPHISLSVSLCIECSKLVERSVSELQWPSTDSGLCRVGRCGWRKRGKGTGRTA